jgi:hypothetical protein
LTVSRERVGCLGEQSGGPRHNAARCLGHEDRRWPPTHNGRCVCSRLPRFRKSSPAPKAPKRGAGSDTRMAGHRSRLTSCDSRGGPRRSRGLRALSGNVLSVALARLGHEPPGSGRLRALPAEASDDNDESDYRERDRNDGETFIWEEYPVTGRTTLPSRSPTHGTEHGALGGACLLGPSVPGQRIRGCPGGAPCDIPRRCAELITV